MEYPKLNRLSLKDKPWIDKYSSIKAHELSSYKFPSLYIWQKHFKFLYRVINDNLCIFARDKIGAFMYLPPLGGRVLEKTIFECFKIMDSLNVSPNVSRIENIEKNDLPFYKAMGLKIISKDSEYLCKRSELTGLPGKRFKSKRALVNYFLKNYRFSFEDFRPGFKDECLRLYKRWKKERLSKYKDPVYKAMIEDNLYTHTTAMDYFSKLGLEGKVIKIDGKIYGYTLGYALNKEIFCILFEITDLKIKGISQFIFREFCARLDGYDYINIMDDSGLMNLRKTKLSYHPFREIESFIATSNK
ncbi:MAG: phosphatidylglycerol lysyltransferase domain-containing protein [Candidatus Omnitrophota bacterium]